MSDPVGALPKLAEVIREAGLQAKKTLGQNFILDLNLTRRIARAPGVVGGRDVIEIGPGPGGLTRALLLEGARKVLVIEQDERCLPILERIATAAPGRLAIEMGDALEANWPSLLVDHGLERPVIIANLPYNIATKLLIGWLETQPWPPWFSGMALMFQLEVAERIVAPQGTKAYGRLAVIAQWRTQARIALRLPPDAFTPQPKVASAVVVLEPRAEPTPVCDVRLLGRITAAAFGQRRKMLRSSLKQVTPMPELLLAKAGIPGDWRGEQVDIAGFARLAAALGAGG